jgi:hypothetical protein
MFSPRGKTSAGSQKYDPRCRKCYKIFSEENFASVQNQKAHKQQLLDIINNAKQRCVVCGYSKFKGALDFHHIDPSTKIADIGSMVSIRSIGSTTADQLVDEIGKCVVLCSNCHRELHGGVLDL